MVGELDGRGQVADRHFTEDKVRRTDSSHSTKFLRFIPASPDSAFNQWRLMKLEEAKHFGRRLFEQRFERQWIELAAKLKMVIVAVNVGSAGEFEAAFRERGDEIRQAPDRGRITEAGVHGGNPHATIGAITGFKRAVELKRGQDLAAPVRGCVRP